MTTLNMSAVRIVVIAAAAGLLLATSVASAQTSIRGGQGPSTHRPGHLPPVPLPNPRLTVKPFFPPPPPFEPRLSALPDTGGTRDFYCSDSNDNYAACDAAFTQKCKDAGGTMSDLQGWGGKTCFEPS